MKNFQYCFLKFREMLILALLALLGISQSCKQTVEYGVPAARFIAKGTIESADSLKAIKGIQVVMESDTFLSDKDGKFEVSTISFPVNQSFKVSFKDIDGQQNGLYSEFDSLVYFSNPDFDNNEWTAEDTERVLDVKLKRD